jgi:L-amino acid N-acyltransferase YncA
MTLEIRDARPDDAESIVAVLNPIIAAGVFTALDTPFTADAEREFIRAFPARGVFLVAVRTSDRLVVGFQNLEPFAGYTHAFDHVGVIGTYVDLDCRRQGIATALFHATFAAASRKGYEKIFTFVRADNEAALSTYQRQGFQIVGTARKHAKLGDRYVDETIIEKLLTAKPGVARREARPHASLLRLGKGKR